MNLTKQIIKKLEEKYSKIKPSLRIDGSFPEDTAFLYPELGKGFVFERTLTKNKYSFTLIEDNIELNCWYCHARGFVDGIEDIVNLIIDWCEGNKNCEELTTKFSEIDCFKRFIPKHKNEKIEKAWARIKNRTFNYAFFWKRIEWEKLNNQILEHARKMSEFEDYFPFASHGCLRFSLNEELTETWTLDLLIQPSHDLTRGSFQVSTDFNNQDESTKYFDDVNEALIFLYKKMSEQKPTKWI